MRFLRKADVAATRLGILAGAFHPPTRAHLALAQASLDLFETDEVLFVLPRRFPHKKYEAVGMEQRAAMLLESTRHEPRFSVAISEGGLFLEIARECREFYPPATRLRFLCGRDTAERIVQWGYAGHPPIDEQLREFELLVARRKGEYVPPEHLRQAIRPLAFEESYDAVSSTEVRRRIRAGEPWEHLVPPPIIAVVRELYREQANSTASPR
jgi:nicotinate-nucleotide adenylyltransferase